MSSHREAPGISSDPAADNTDVYAFVSPDRPSTVTLLSNFIPLQEPAGGPNFFLFGDDVLYEILVDNNGDGVEDVTYQFRFATQTMDSAAVGSSFLFNDGPITSLDSSHLLVKQSYSVTKVMGPRRTGVAVSLATGLPTPPPNIGPASVPGYAALAATAVQDLPGGGKVFAGQRGEAFYVNLGQIFDLLQIGGAGKTADYTSGFNVHTIGIQVPITDLVADSPSIGIWSAASRQKATVRDKDARVQTAGPFVQVSRLGNPLINEVIIPRKMKDYWNSQEPVNDSQFLSFYLEPEVAKLLKFVVGLGDVPLTNRTDLRDILLTGLAGLNKTSDALSDQLRLNTSIPPGTTNARLGVLAGDLAGFPNGRRVADDIVDIELSAVRGTVLDATAHPVIGDLVDRDADASTNPLLGGFPYLPTPHAGSDHTHHHDAPPA